MAAIPPIRILTYPNFWIYFSLGKPASRFPSCLLRSYLLSIVLKVDSISEWCRLLKITLLYAILSGFPAGDATPLETARLERSRRICGCPKGSDCGCRFRKRPSRFFDAWVCFQAWYAILPAYLFCYEIPSSWVSYWKTPAGFCPWCVPALWILQNERHYPFHWPQPRPYGAFQIQRWRYHSGRCHPVCKLEFCVIQITYFGCESKWKLIKKFPCFRLVFVLFPLYN